MPQQPRVERRQCIIINGVRVKRDDEVLIPNFTFIATANAAKLVGAKVKFIDINYENLNIDVKKLKNL